MERVTRLVIGALIVAVVITTQTVSLMEIFVGIIGMMLILNGIFSRCYVWYVLDLNTSDKAGTGTT